LLIGDDLAGIAFGRETLAHQLVEPELLGSSDLLDPIQRLSHRDAAECRGDLVGGHRLDLGGRQADLAVHGAEVERAAGPARSRACQVRGLRRPSGQDTTEAS
jgi:hypothetical protein